MLCWQATSLTPTPTTLALPNHTMHGHQKKPELTKFYSLFKLTALCALFHEAAAQASTTTLAGGKAGFKDGDAASAQFDQPTGVAMHPKGFLLVAVRA